MPGGRGGGSVYFNKRLKKWVAEVRWVNEATGKVDRIVKYADSKRDAEALRAELVSQRYKGLLSTPSRATVRDFALHYLRQLESGGLKPNSLRLAGLELAYALPSLKDPTRPDPLGPMRLQEVKPIHLQEAINRVRESYAPRTVRKVYNRLKALFREAVALELIPRNPAESIKLRLPEGEKAARALEPWEIERLLEEAERSRSRDMALLLRLILETGLRRGEALALQWKDVDLDQGELRVWRTWGKVNGKGSFTSPKTRAARRVIPLPHGLRERLRSLRDQLLERLTPEALNEVFIFGGDRPFDPDAFNHYLRRLANRAGLGRIRVHDLRHTWATLALSRGIPLEVVSQRLGHASPNVTLGIYRHLLEEERRDYVLDLENLIRGPRPRPQA